MGFIIDLYKWIMGFEPPRLCLFVHRSSPRGDSRIYLDMLYHKQFSSPTYIPTLLSFGGGTLYE